MSNGQSTAGTCLFVTAEAPATYDQAGFEALASWVASEEVENFGTIGAVAEIIEFTTVCDNTVNKRVGAVNYGTQSLEIIHDSLNAAQLLIEAATETRTPLFVRIDMSSTDVIYYRAYVTEAPLDLGGSNQITKLMPVFNIDARPIRVNRTP